MSPSPTWLAIKRRQRNRVATNVAAEVAAVDDVPYRDLQTKAKELGIPANQSADDLKAAIEDAGTAADETTEDETE